jgi:hypothetical protein
VNDEQFAMSFNLHYSFIQKALLESVGIWPDNFSKINYDINYAFSGDDRCKCAAHAFYFRQFWHYLLPGRTLLVKGP